MFEYISLFLSGATITAVVNYFISAKKEKREDFTAILYLWRKDNERLREIEESLKQKIEHLETSIQELKIKLLLFENTHMELPIPMWVKDEEGVMVMVNSAYEKAFLHPLGKVASDYIGKKDTDLWPPTIAAKFRANDLAAIRETMYFHEEIPVANKTYNLFVIKYPRKVNGETVGVAGLALDKKLIK